MFSAVKLNEKADIDKYKYCGYGIAFDRGETLSFPTGGMGCNVIISGEGMRSSAHVDNKKNIV